MSILGVVVRVRPQHRGVVVPRLSALAGVDVALDPGDGRLVLVIEDGASADGRVEPAAATMAAIAQWPEVLATSLVYESSSGDADAAPAVADYRAWRGSLQSLVSSAAHPAEGGMS